MDQESDGNQRLKVVKTAFKILNRLVEADEMGVTELGKELDIPKSTAHTYLKTLEECGYVINMDGTYRISLKLLKHGGNLRGDYDIYQAGKSEIDALARETDEVANLSVEERGQRVILYGAEGENAIWDDTQVGDHAYLHWTAMGKAMLSQFPKKKVEHLIDEKGLPQATEETITEREPLFKELQQIRERGFSIERDEHKLGISAVGAPVTDSDGELLGAISVVGPTNRFSENGRIDELGQRLLESVNVIELQYTHY
jgi:DNA-binding IclR family transcriptional regulator